MKKRWVSVVCALAMGISMTAGLSVPACAEETVQNAGTGEHLDAALYWFGTSLDPAVDYDGWTLVRAGIGETLVTIDADLNIVGQLSDEWEMVDDVTWKMHIRDGVTFHNGKPVDGEAVKACLERTMSMQERAVTAAKIEKVEADGQYVIITTSEPFGAFLANISEPLYAIIDVTADSDPATAPIATGPYMVTDFTVDTEIQEVRYEDYWGGTPGVESITVKCIGDDNTRALALQAGDIDIMQRIASTDLPLFEDNEDYAVYDTAGTRITNLWFNFNNQFLGDYNVRKAIECAIDYDAVADVLGSGVSAAGAPYPASAPYGYDELEIQHYDPEKAAACLAESGYEDTDGDGILEKDGAKLSLTLSYDDNTLTSAFEAIQYMLSKVGIEITLDMQENTDEPYAGGDYEIMFRKIQSLSTGDPQWLLDTFYKTGGFYNTGGYSNEEMDALCDKLTTAFDLEERQALTIEAEKMILADCLNIMLVVQDNYVVASSKVKNVDPFPIDYYFITKDITIEE